MSKRFWLPTSKGTEPGPQVQPLTKLVIRGVPAGTPLYDTVAQAFGGQLKQFHGKQQQAYSLSGNQIHKGRIDWGGARATYTNQFGRELLELEVDTSILSELSKHAESYWDFALLELFVPNMHYTDGALQLITVGHVTSPTETKTLDLHSPVWPVNGIAIADDVATDGRASDPDIIINAATYDNISRTDLGASVEAYSSFTVDLRPARGLSAVTVDLHPYIFANIEVLSGGAIAFTTRPTLTNAPPTDYILNDGNGGYQVLPGDPTPPATTIDGAGQRVFVSTGTPHIIVASGVWLQGGDTIDASGAVVHVPVIYWWTEYFVYSGIHRLGYSGPSLVPAEIQLTLFQGRPVTSVAKYGDETLLGHPGYARWDISGKEFKDTRIARANVPVYDNSTFPSSLNTPSNMLGIPKLGTVTIGLKTTDGASWNPAP